MNCDTGEAETPAHPRAIQWRRDLDYAVARYEKQHDRELDVEEKIAAMTPAEKDAMIKQAMLAEQPVNYNSFDAKPNMRSPIMQALKSGRPISRAEAKRRR
jgi:hypothetical protein